jgi:quercetin dioxygenase-like cupin family protein
MQIYTHLFEQTIKQGESFEPPSGHNAIWVQSGALNDGSNLWNAGDGFYAGSRRITSHSPTTSMLCFNFGRSADDTSVQKTLLKSKCHWPDPESILRLDSVTFPKGAIAYRHVHAGAGTRYLVQGGLEIKSDHNVEHMANGDAWFEDANSPVKATAIDTQISQFIRALILPIEYAGKPTIKFLNSEDFDKPKEQTNHRFFDQRITL